MIGGERKRTSVGVEIITNPSIIFLDEPISGLDSYGSYSLILLLKRIAKSNASIIFTIHQPSSEIFFLLDKVMFLKAGRVLYEGSVHHLVEFFQPFGYSCPPNYNPADYVMFLCQTESEEVLDHKGVFPESPPHEVGQNGLGLPHVEAKDYCETVCKFFLEIYWITYREFLSTIRNKPALMGRFGVVIVINVLFALIFNGAGGRNDGNQSNFTGHLGAVVIVASAAMFNTALPSIVNFPSERLRFINESVVGTYSAGSYMIGKTLVELPLALIQSFIQTLVVYWTIEFQGSFILLVFILCAIAIASGALGILLGCLVRDPKHAVEMAPLLFVPQLLFVGFYIRTSMIPVYIRWFQYLCPLKYGVNLAFLNEYVPTEGRARDNWAMMLDENDIHPSDWWIYVLILLSIYCGSKILSSIILASRH
jgi:ABC-type multidrug transport system permease subunit